MEKKITLKFLFQKKEISKKCDYLQFKIYAINHTFWTYEKSHFNT